MNLVRDIKPARNKITASMQPGRDRGVLKLNYDEPPMRVIACAATRIGSDLWPKEFTLTGVLLTNVKIP